MSTDQTPPPAKQPRREIRILIIAKNVPNFQKAAQFLTRRGWPSDVVGNVKQAVEYVVKHRPMFVMVSFSHPNGNVTKLPNLLTQTFKANCIAFGESTDPKTTARLHACRLKHIFYGVLSGPSIHMRIKKILIDMENEARKAQQAQETKQAAPVNPAAAVGEAAQESLDQPSPQSAIGVPGAQAPGQVIMKGRSIGPRQDMVLGQPGQSRERGFYQTPGYQGGDAPDDQAMHDDQSAVEEGESYWGKKKYGQDAEADYMDYDGAKEPPHLAGEEDLESLYMQEEAQGFDASAGALSVEASDEEEYIGEDADFDAQAFLAMAAQHGEDPSAWPEGATGEAASFASDFQDAESNHGVDPSANGYQPHHPASNMTAGFYNPQQPGAIQGQAMPANQRPTAEGYTPQHGGSASVQGPGFYNPQASIAPEGGQTSQNMPSAVATSSHSSGEMFDPNAAAATTPGPEGFQPAGFMPDGTVPAELSSADPVAMGSAFSESASQGAHVRNPELADVAELFDRGLKGACEPLIAPPRKIGDLDSVGVMTVISPSTSGYLLFAVPRGTGVGTNLIQKIQSCVQEELEGQRMDFRLTDQFETKIETVSFVSWAQAEADFMSVQQHHDHELAIAFFAVPNVPRLRPSDEAENMSVVDLSCVIPDVPVQFRGYINFKKNDKMILYVKSGRSISQDQKSRLMQKNVGELFIPDSEAGIFVAQMAQATINQKIQSYRLQRLRRAS